MQMCSDQKGKKGKSQDANMTRKNFCEPNMSHYKRGGVRGKVKVVLFVHTKKAYKGGRGIVALILNLSTRQRWLENIMLQPLYPQQKKNPDTY